MRPHIEYFVQFWVTQYKTHTTILEGVQRAPGRSVAYSTWCRRGWERAGFACSGEWKVNRDHLAKYLMCGYRADRARVLPYQVQTKQIRGNGQNMQNKKFLIDNQRMFFTMKVVKHWNRLPRACCRISSPHRHPELIWAWHRVTYHSQLPRFFEWVHMWGEMSSRHSFQTYSVILSWNEADGKQVWFFFKKKEKTYHFELESSTELNKVTLCWHQNTQTWFRSIRMLW